MHLGVYQPQLDRRLKDGTRSGWTSTGPACAVRARSSSRVGTGQEDDAEEEEGRVSRGSETPLSVSDLDEFASAQGSDEDAPLVDANEDADSSDYNFTSTIVDVVDPEADAMDKEELEAKETQATGAAGVAQRKPLPQPPAKDGAHAEDDAAVDSPLTPLAVLRSLKDALRSLKDALAASGWRERVSHRQESGLQDGPSCCSHRKARPRPL